MFGNCTRYEPRYSTVKQFTFLEAVLSDSYESLMCCNEDGSFQYEENPVAYRDFQNIAKIQDGILDFDQALSIWDDVTNRSEDSSYRDFCDMILNTIFNGNCMIDETIKKAIVIDGMNDFKPPYQVLT